MKLRRTIQRRSQLLRMLPRRLKYETLEERALLAGFQVPAAPLATDNVYDVTEDTQVVGNLLTDDTGSGADTGAAVDAPLVITQLNGQLFEPGEPIVLPSGATVTVSADGSFSYDPTTSAEFSAIPNGAAATDAFTYTTSVGFSEMYVFGDSLSDIGNMYDATSELGFGFPPPPYFKGRASDGPIWAEFLAPRLGHTLRDLSEPSPNLYAVYGAQTDDGNFNEGNPLFPFPELDFDGLANEIDNYVAAVGGVADPKALYVVWAGSNDFFNPPADPVTAITASVQNIATAVGTLKAIGAENIVVPNMPDLGLTPRALQTGVPEQFTQFTMGFNAALEGTMASFFPDVETFDTFTLLNEIVASPQSHGFSDVTTECFDFVAGTLCSNPDNHLFWDNVHPTTRGHEIIGDMVYEQLLTLGPLSASNSATVFIEISDVTTHPEAAIVGPLQAVPGQQIQFELSSADASPADNAGVFQYDIDWNNDAVVDETVYGTAVGVTVEHEFQTSGGHTITVTAIDQDGDHSDTTSWSLEVTAAAVIGGDLHVGGTMTNDNLRFRQVGSRVKVFLNRRDIGTYSLSPSAKVFAYGLAGNDRISAGNLRLRTEFHGAGGNDTLIGGRNDDLLDGGAGNDRVFARAGNDTILGGAGRDWLWGSRGDDHIMAGAGQDFIFGQAGDDLLSGNDGDDWIFGGAGNDILQGNSGNDRLFGQLGDDDLDGGDGVDWLFGGPGDDELKNGRRK